MTIKERLNLTFHKKEMVKIYIIDEANRVHLHYIRMGDKSRFTLYDDRMFDVNNKAVTYDKGLPTYFYSINNPEPVDPHEEGLLPNQVTSESYYNAINNEVLGDIIKYSKGKKQDQNGMLMIMLIVVIIGMLGGFYYLYTLIAEIQAFNNEYKDVFDAIRQALLGGDLIG